MAKDITAENRAILAFLLLSINYAMFGVFARELSHDLELFQQVYLRYMFGLLIAVFALRARVQLQITALFRGKDAAILWLRMFLGVIFGAAGFTAAVQLTTLANVTFLCAIPYPAFWGALLFHERMSAPRIIALLFSIIGAAFITVVSQGGQIDFGLGEVLAILSGAFFTLSMIIRRYHTPTLSDRELSFLGMLAGIVLAIIASALHSEPVPTHLSLSTMGWLSGAGASIFLNTWLSNFAFRTGDAVVGGVILSTEMLFAICVGYFLYQEVPSEQQLFGGALILFGVLVVTFETLRVRTLTPLITKIEE